MTHLQPYLQPLNSLDRFELGVHEFLQSIGQPGLKLQLHLWLEGRVDLESLRASISRLARLHPVSASRLAHSWRRVRWRTDRDADCPLEVHDLATDDEAAVWALAERLISRFSAPDKDPPLTFHLLRRPSAGDVLFVEWVHALMDGKAGEMALCELNRLYREQGTIEAPRPPQRKNEPMAHIKSYPLRKRIAAVRGTLRRGAGRRTVLLMSDRDLATWVSGPMRLTGRVIDEERTAAVVARAKKLCGFANLTPPLLASTYRAIGSHAPEGDRADRMYRAPVPINLRPPGAREPIFRNLVTYVGLSAVEEELADRDELTRLLNHRMRKQFASRSDLGSLIVMSRIARSRLIQRRLGKHPRSKISLGYAYHGEMPGDLEQFCGVPVAREFFMTSLPAPPGLGISVNLCRGRLNISMVFVSKVIPEALAHGFLDSFVEDLTRNGAGR